jgi:hypothetical protein
MPREVKRRQRIVIKVDTNAVTDITNVTTLSDSEKFDVLQAMFLGPSYLVDKGMNGDQIQEWLSRPEIQARIRLLEMEYGSAKSMQRRTQFVVDRKLAGGALLAADVLLDALRGQEYARNKDGSFKLNANNCRIAMHDLPTAQQVEAANDILDRLGCRADPREVMKTSDLPVLHTISKAAEAVVMQVDEDPNAHPVEKALSHERVRNAIEIMSRFVKGGKEKLDAVLNQSQAEIEKTKAQAKLNKAAKSKPK